MSDAEHVGAQSAVAHVDTCLMRSDASGDAIVCGLWSCRAPFTPRKPWQRYCCSEHRVEANKLRDDGGVRGIVKSNRLLKGGKRSITLHFEAGDDDKVLRLEPGKVAEIL